MMDSQSSETPIICEGWLRKRGTQVGSRKWTERYFVLRNNELSYYIRRGDIIPKGIVLMGGCGVGDVTPRTINNRKLYTFKVDLPDLDSSSPPPLPPPTINSPSRSTSSNVDDDPDPPDPPSSSSSFSSSNAPATPSNDSRHSSNPHEIDKKARRKKNIQKGAKIAAGTAGAITIGVLTAGVGLAAGLAVVGVSSAVGGGGAVGAYKYNKSKKIYATSLIVGSESFETAQEWKEAIDASVLSAKVADTTWSKLFGVNGRSTAQAILSSLNQPPTMSSNSGIQSASQRWRPVQGGWANYIGSGAGSLRIFEEESAQGGGSKQEYVSVAGRPCPPLKAQIVLDSTPLNAFMCLMSEFSSLDVVAEATNHNFRIVETIDEHSDIIAMTFKPLFLFPSWTAPRDFCLMRYWKLDDDGSYVVCYDSVTHRECPPVANHVRGQLHSVWTICPRKDTTNGEEISECLLTYIVQVDPRGWVPTISPPWMNQTFADAFSVAALLSVLDVQDALTHDKFVTAPLVGGGKNTFARFSNSGSRSKSNSGNCVDAVFGRDNDNNNSNKVDESMSYDYNSFEAHPNRQNSTESITSSAGTAGLNITNFPEPIPSRYWSDPDANAFVVRGKSYKTNKKKINAGKSVFRMLAVDVVESSESLLMGMCSLAGERVQTALKRERDGGAAAPPFVVAINIAIPGPPMYSVVIYFAVDDINDITGKGSDVEFSKLANEFFFGESDSFRDKTFKLIPHIVEGNFLVRRAVGSTPAIIGTKLRQTYVRSDRYFELVLDIGSSSVASGVVRLALGYAKTLIVDMAFVLQGDDETTLPERVFGVARLKNLNFEDPRFRFINPLGLGG